MLYKIAIASGKGGTGKTTVSVNLHHFFAQSLNQKVQLVDCDVEEPNDAIFFSDASKTESKDIFQLIPEIDLTKCTFCRKCAEYCEFNAIVVIPSAKFAEVNASLCHSCGACTVACKYNAITEIELAIGKINFYKLPQGNGLVEGELRIGSAMQTKLIKELKKHVSAENQIVIYDAPPGTSCPVVETVSNVDYIILVSEPTPFGLYDLKLMVNLLAEIKTPFGVIVNKAGLGNNDIYEFLSSEGIELLGEIPFSPTYAASYASGNMLNEIPAEISESFNEITEKMKIRLKL